MSEEENEQPLVERLRWSDGWFFEDPWDHVTYASDDPFEAADEIERLRMANRALRRGLYGLMDSDDADDIAATLEAGGEPEWDKYPANTRAALETKQ